MTDCVIETQNACKHYGKMRALDQVSIRVRRGEIYGLIGDNGAGKTTLLKALVGHIWCDEGTVHLLGSQSAHELNAARRQVGAMIERVGCFPSLTVEKNIEYCRMLMQNASRYATSYLAIENTVASGRVVTTFENDAEGLTEETIAHLFDRFYTGDAARAGGGTGLGLTIAKELTEQMGGALSAQLIGGSRHAVRFTLSFPLAKSET